MPTNGTLFLQWIQQDGDIQAAVLMEGMYILLVNLLERNLASVVRSNVNSNTWESVASLKSSRSPHAFMGCGDYIFFINGRSYGSETNIVEKYNIDSTEWSQVSQMITKRFGLTFITCGDSIYSIGGYNGSISEEC